MKIAVIGAGAIGSIIAGFLKQSGNDVILTGHSQAVEAINKNGLKIKGHGEEIVIKLKARPRLEEKPQLAIIATKTQDLQQAINENIDFIREAVVLTTQNGLQADVIARKYIPGENLVSSIVMFGATCLVPGEVVYNFKGSWIIGKPSEGRLEGLDCLKGVLGKAFEVVVTDQINGMRFLKVFVNANNCIPAILGKSIQEAFSDINISSIAIGIWKEGLELVNKAGIKLSSLPNFPLERLLKLTAMPSQEAAGILSGIMVSLSKEPLYGSILQSIRRNKSSEIDYINGEFVNLTKNSDLDAPLNKRLIEMVHRVEKTGKFFSKEDLIKDTQELISLYEYN